MLSTLGIEPCVLHEDVLCESRLGVRHPGVRDGPKVEATSLSAPTPHFIVLSPGPAFLPEDCRVSEKVENKGRVAGAKYVVPFPCSPLPS